MATTRSRKTAISQPPAKKAAGKKTVTRQAIASKAAVEKPRKAAKAPASKLASGRASTNKAVSKPVPTKKAVAGKAAAAKTAARKAPAKKAVVKKSTQQAHSLPPARSVVTKAAAPKRPAKPSPVKASTKAAKRTASPCRITPKQALANTRNLLEAKQAHDREALPWQALDTHSHGIAPKSGFQSEEAKDKAGELHAGESRLNAIEGSISSQDRHSQGKRDSR